MNKQSVSPIVNRSITIRIEIRNSSMEIDAAGATYQDLYNIAVNLLSLVIIKLPKSNKLYHKISTFLGLT